MQSTKYGASEGAKSKWADVEVAEYQPGGGHVGDNLQQSKGTVLLIFFAQMHLVGLEMVRDEPRLGNLTERFFYRRICLKPKLCSYCPILRHCSPPLSKEYDKFL